MTRRTNARIAGFTYLLYIAVAFPAMVLFDKATSGESTASQLATIAQHSTSLRITILLGLVSCFCALVLAVTLYGSRATRIGSWRCWHSPAGSGKAWSQQFHSLRWTAVARNEHWAHCPRRTVGNALAALLLKLGGWQTTTAAVLFAVGSTLFSYLLLRGRMIPVALAWLGVFGSALPVVRSPAAARRVRHQLTRAARLDPGGSIRDYPRILADNQGRCSAGAENHPHEVSSRSAHNRRIAGYSLPASFAIFALKGERLHRQCGEDFCLLDACALGYGRSDRAISHSPPTWWWIARRLYGRHRVLTLRRREQNFFWVERGGHGPRSRYQAISA